jgi:hypothetical protein
MPGTSLARRLALVATLIAAVVCLPIVPPDHVHRGGIEGRSEPLVHAHSSPAPRTVPSSQPDVEASHGDHRLAVYLDSNGFSSPRFSVSAPATLVSRMYVLPLISVARSAPVSSVPIHGPPGPVHVTRGPPVAA